jgi:hypothetical protein
VRIIEVWQQTPRESVCGGSASFYPLRMLFLPDVATFKRR